MIDLEHLNASIQSVEHENSARNILMFTLMRIREWKEEKKKRGEEWKKHEQSCDDCKLNTEHKKDIFSGSNFFIS
jgi:hypothetical protein